MVVLVFGLCLHGRMLWYQWHEVVSGSGDFVAYYTAGKIIESENSRALADLKLQEELQQRLNFSGQTEFLPFYHAPYQAILFWPFSFLSYPNAHLAWSALSLILLILVYARLAPFVDKKQTWLYGLILLATYPTWLSFVKGQDTMISALILVCVFGYLKLGHNILTGFTLALGLYKPQLVLPIAGILALGNHRHATASFVVTGLVLVAISLLMITWDGAIGLGLTLAARMHQGVLDYSFHMPTIRGLVSTLSSPYGNPNAALALGAIVSILLYTGCLMLLKNQFNGTHELFGLQFSFALVTTLLINPHSHAYEFVLLAISLIFAFDYVMREAPRQRFLRPCVLSVLLVFSLPVLPNLLASYQLMGLASVPVLVLYFALWSEIRTSGRQSPNDRISKNLRIL
ncbi:MAG: glycosyltransferase family 87 protein [Candidatus Binatia bacterium]